MRRNPQFIAQIAGKTGTTDHQCLAFKVEFSQTKGLELLYPAQAHGLEDSAGCRPLHCQGCHPGSLILDCHIKTQGRPMQPVDGVSVGAEAVIIVRQVEYGAIIHYLPGIITPHRIAHTTDAYLADIPGDQPIQVSLSVRPGNSIFIHRGQVEDPGGTAHRKIFQLHIYIGVRCGVTHPIAPAVQLAGRRHPRVKGRGQHHGVIAFIAHAAGPRLIISRAAFLPANPITPPPG